MIYRIQGSLDAALLMPVFDQTKLSAEELYRFLPERFSGGDGKREIPRPIPDWFKFVLLPREESNGVVHCVDAMGTVAGGFGIDTFISLSARERLEPHLGEECEFFEVEIAGAPEPYFAMWVTRVIDALDFEKVKYSEARYLPKKGTRYPLQLYSYEFREERAVNGFLFRIPGRELSEASMHDYATEGFVDLVKRLRVSGFQFSRNTHDPPFAPVPLPHLPIARH